MNQTAETAPEIRATDFLNIDRLLSDEERLIRETVRSFVADGVLPNIGRWFEQATIPTDLLRELGRLGLLGMHQHGYGCAGASATASGVRR